MADFVLAAFMSLDGFIEGPEGFVAPAWSDDLETHWSGHTLARAGHLVYGRKCFTFNTDFWLDETGPAAEIAYADRMNDLPKTVLSTTLADGPGWNATVARDMDALAARIAELKRADPSDNGGDVIALGGAGLAQSLIAADLADEHNILVTPDLFGGGKRLFAAGGPRLTLEHMETRPLDTGATILRYRRKRGA